MPQRAQSPIIASACRVPQCCPGCNHLPAMTSVSGSPVILVDCRSSIDRMLPFELRAMESGLAAAVRTLEVEAMKLERSTVPALQRLMQKVSQLHGSESHSCTCFFLLITGSHRRPCHNISLADMLCCQPLLWLIIANSESHDVNQQMHCRCPAGSSTRSGTQRPQLTSSLHVWAALRR